MIHIYKFTLTALLAILPYAALAVDSETYTKALWRSWEAQLKSLVLTQSVPTSETDGQSDSATEFYSLGTSLLSDLGSASPIKKNAAIFSIADQVPSKKYHGSLNSFASQYSLFLDSIFLNTDADPKLVAKLDKARKKEACRQNKMNYMREKTIKEWLDFKSRTKTEISLDNYAMQFSPSFITAQRDLAIAHAQVNQLQIEINGPGASRVVEARGKVNIALNSGTRTSLNMPITEVNQTDGDDKLYTYAPSYSIQGFEETWQKWVNGEGSTISFEIKEDTVLGDISNTNATTKIGTQDVPFFRLVSAPSLSIPRKQLPGQNTTDITNSTTGASNTTNSTILPNTNATTPTNGTNSTVPKSGTEESLLVPKTKLKRFRKLVKRQEPLPSSKVPTFFKPLTVKDKLIQQLNGGSINSELSIEPINVASATLKMEFSGFGVFPVQPGRWFDGGIITQFGKHVVQPKSFSESESGSGSGSGSGFQFFGENGTMPGLVSAIVVGYKPKIVVQFDKQGYQEIWQAWSLQKKMIENGLTGNSNLTNNATLTNSTGNLNETTTDLNTAANTTTSQAPELFVGPFKVNVPAENQLGEKSATVTGFIPTFKNDSQTLVLSNGNDALPVILGYIGKKFQL